jgi:hypothetical protein
MPIYARYTDVDTVETNSRRLAHEPGTTAEDTLNPLRYLEQAVTKALESTRTENFNPHRRANIGVDSIAPKRRFNKYEQVWYTTWLQHAFTIDPDLLAERDALRHPNVWTDVTGSPLRVALEVVLTDRLMDKTEYSCRGGLSVACGTSTDKPEPTLPDSDILSEDPFTPTETKDIITALRINTANWAQQHDLSFEAAYNDTYYRFDAARFPSTAAGAASVLDSLQFLYGADGSESIEEEQVRKSAISGWTDAVDSLLYHALKRPVRRGIDTSGSVETLS